MDLVRTNCIYQGSARAQYDVFFHLSVDEMDTLQSALAILNKYNYAAKEAIQDLNGTNVDGADWNMINHYPHLASNNLRVVVEAGATA